jgi:hypothetical protein
MAGLLQKLFRLLNRDLTGRTWQREVTHPYFGPMLQFGHVDSAKNYWEAELTHPTLTEKFSVTLKGTSEGPEPSEELFCRTILADPDKLFLKCRDAFQHEFPTRAKGPFPSDWRKVFVLDGLFVPLHGDANAVWDICYFVKPAGRYFTAKFESDRVVQVLVDG